MSNSYCHLGADILVIGGGSGGAVAAIWAKEVNPAQRVVVFEKGGLKYSGYMACEMEALDIVPVPGASRPAEYLEVCHLTSQSAVDGAPSYAIHFA